MHKPNSCFFSLTAHSSRSHNPPPTLPPHITFFFDCCPPPTRTHTYFFLSFSCLCCLLLLLSLSLPLSVCLTLFLSFSPFLWLAVSLGLCTFLAGKSEALSKHQLPRSAQRNPTWLFLHCRPPLLTPPLSSQLLHSLTPKNPSSPLFTPQNSPATLPSSSLC